MAYWRNRSAANRISRRTVSLSNIVLTNIGSSAIRPFGVVDGVLYGYNNSGDVIHSSTNGGSSWTQVTGVTLGTPVGGTGVCRKIIKCSDGQVLILRENSLVKSVGWGTATPTWVVKASVSTLTGTTSIFKEWGLQFNGSRGILTEYASTWSSITAGSTNVWITTDGGNTWTVELSTGAGTFTDIVCHWHGVCLDDRSERYFVSMGHGNQVGVYVRDWDNATWYAMDMEPHKLDNLRSTSSTSPLYSCMTCMEATPRSVIMGSDDYPCCIAESLATLPTNAQRADVIFFDDDLDLMNWWIEASLFQSSTGATLLGSKLTPSSVQKPRLYAAIDGKAQMIWEYPNAIGSTTNMTFRNILDMGDNEILALIQLNTDFWTVSATVVIGGE